MTTAREQTPPESSPTRSTLRRRLLGLNLAVRLLMVLAACVALVPLLAVLRGAVAAVRLGFEAPTSSGIWLSLIALTLGSWLFVYSVKYYLSTLVMLVSSLVLSNGSNNESGHTNGPAHSKGNGHPHGLMRFLRRRNGWNGTANGNGNGNPNFDLGYEPFVSIHIATYNEKRVIGRLLDGCAALDYTNYEVIVVDDSTDETRAILESWRERPRFKVIHRPSRDGFKGGALLVALQNTDPKAEFVIVWDADVVPFPDSIWTYLPHFFRPNGNGNGEGDGNGGGNGRRRDVTQPLELRPEVAAVQSYQWHILNKSESWLTEAVRAEYAGSYMVERPFQEFVGALKMIAGTGYMIRADLLRKLGWGRSLTEDWEMTLRLYALGFKVVYTPYAESPAECVSTFGRLARQRMRWAEGHSYNVRRRFFEIMGSKRLGVVEKLEFLFYSSYYLQAALFVVGSASWFISEVFLHAHVPEWTAVLGWSLVFSNLLSLPVMNFSGLLLEEAPAKDFIGVLGALAISFLLVPFQAYAAVKGFLERDEGPWYRTPKTGVITDPIHHLRRLAWLRKWLFGAQPQRARRNEVRQAAPLPRRRERRPRRLGWVVMAALALAVGCLTIGATRAPVAQAANQSLFLHGGIGPFTLDGTSPGGLLPSNLILLVGTSRTWATTASTTSTQTIFSTTAFSFNYWTTGLGGSANVTLTFAFSAAANCSSPTTIAQTTTGLASGSNLSTGAFSPASNVVVPAGSFFCLTLAVNSIGLTLTLDSDASGSPTNLVSTQTIFIPESAIAFLGLALMAPLAVRARRRRGQEVAP